MPVEPDNQIYERYHPLPSLVSLRSKSKPLSKPMAYLQQANVFSPTPMPGGEHFYTYLSLDDIARAKPDEHCPSGKDKTSPEFHCTVCPAYIFQSKTEYSKLPL